MKRAFLVLFVLTIGAAARADLRLARSVECSAFPGHVFVSLRMNANGTIFGNAISGFHNAQFAACEVREAAILCASTWTGQAPARFAIERQNDGTYKGAIRTPTRQAQILSCLPSRSHR